MKNKKLTLEEIMKKVEELNKQNLLPELTLITCAVCENSIVIKKHLVDTLKEHGTEMACENCERLDRFKDDIKTIFKDKEFVQCLKELMKGVE